MIWSDHLIPSQEGKTVLITGANSGLGFESAKALLNKGARVILSCRSTEKAELARKKLLVIVPSAKIELLELDLTDLEELDRATDLLLDNYEKLDILINNAGVMAPPFTRTKQGLEVQFGVNHLSHMALTLKLMPLLVKQAGSRVVTVSSGVQYFGKINWKDLQSENNYDRWSAYSQSKLANVMFALELDCKLKIASRNVHSFSAHPGFARTNLQSTFLASNGSFIEAFAYKFINPIFQSSYMGALPQLFAATEPNAKGGSQYGPRFNFRGYPKVCRVAKAALNIESRQKLWEKSDEIISQFVDLKFAKTLLGK